MVDIPVFGIETLSKNTVINGGDGTGTAAIGGILSINTTSATTAGTAEETLISYSLPANTLSKNGIGVEIVAWGKLAANADEKLVRLKFGASAELMTTSANNKAWILKSMIYRTGAGAQDRLHSVELGGGTVNISIPSTPAEDETGAIVIALTADDTGAGDTTCEGLLVKLLNN